MKLSDKQLRHLRAVAEDAATVAGKYIQSQFGHSIKVQKKANASSAASEIFSEVDLKAEELIVSKLMSSIRSYDLGLLTEEAINDNSRLHKDHFWCIDPLDGSLAFMSGKSGYAVSIALISNSGDSIIGVVYLPDKQQLYSSIKGMGVNVNSVEFKSHDQAEKDFHFYIDHPKGVSENFGEIDDKLVSWVEEKLDAKIIHLMGAGAVCNAIGVMRHKNACYFKFPKIIKGGGSIWDFAATHLFFEELKLPVSNALGEKLRLNDPSTNFMNEQGVIYSSNEIAHQFISKLSRDKNN